MLKTGTCSSESFYKKQVEQLVKEKKQLKERVESLESENHDLRRSVFELSFSKAAKQNVLDLDAALFPASNEFRSSNSNTSVDNVVQSMEWEVKDPTSNKGETGGTCTRLGWKFDLAGHVGAVYVVQFSNCGRLVASGSLDKSFRIWQLEKPTEPPVVISDAHASAIADLCWNKDTTSVATGGYDQQVKEWSVEEGAQVRLLNSYSLVGLVQDVEFCMGDPSVLFASTSHGDIHILDRRSRQSTMVLVNDCAVNSIHPHHDGILVTSGDHRGFLKRWDTRGDTKKPLEVCSNSKRPISHLEVSRPRQGEEGQYLSVNSFDNTVRVYDRGGYLLGASHSDTLKLLHTLKGMKSQNWPIRSSFFQGSDYLRSKSGLVTKERMDNRDNTTTTMVGNLSSNSISRYGNLSNYSNSYSNGNNSTSGGTNNPNMNFVNNNLETIRYYRPQETLTLASGSADGNIYIYDVGQSEGCAYLVQCCQGHRDRVYDVCFHPMEPILASCSADYLVKIWGPVKTKAYSVYN
eukprot:jgi/Galph1/3198/GphlegSOOS_G1857.1